MQLALVSKLASSAARSDTTGVKVNPNPNNNNNTTTTAGGSSQEAVAAGAGRRRVFRRRGIHRGGGEGCGMRQSCSDDQRPYAIGRIHRSKRIDTELM